MPREPEPGLVQLRQRRHRVGRLPHPGERGLVGLLHHHLAEGSPLPVLLSLHVHAEQPLEHRIAVLALAVSLHGLLDPRVAPQELRAERLHHVVAVSLRRRHEGLDPAQLQPLLVVQIRPEQPLVRPRELTEGLGVGRIDRAEPRLHALDVQFQRREVVVQERLEPSRAPTAGRTRTDGSPRAARRTCGTPEDRATSPARTPPGSARRTGAGPGPTAAPRCRIARGPAARAFPAPGPPACRARAARAGGGTPRTAPTPAGAGRRRSVRSRRSASLRPARAGP